MANTQPITGVYSPISGQPGTIVVENPPFHPNILNIPGQQNGVANGGAFDTVLGDSNSLLYRGLISTRQQQGSNQIFRVKFLYNPSTIHESRSIDLNNNVVPTYARNPDDPGSYVTGLQATLSFNLLFDRTFELWDSAYVNTDAGKYGTSVDTNAFFNMLNINQQVTQTPTHLGAGSFQDTRSSFTTVVQGVMAPVPVDIYFGYRSVGALKYFGYISQLDITHTHFTQKMVAQRCAIGVGVTLMSDLYSGSTGG
jgi:hypothetical protein